MKEKITKAVELRKNNKPQEAMTILKKPSSVLSG
jgi:hypothetical protein